MLQPSSYHYWYRYHPKTGKRETYTFKTFCTPNYLRDIKFFRKNGTQRSSIVINSNRYYKQ